MNKTFSDQLSMWRTANGVATMKEVLEENTVTIREGKSKMEVIQPHAHIKTNNSKVLGLYVHFKVTLVKITDNMRTALKVNDASEFERLKDKLNSVTKGFFDAIRNATGYENVMAINHENALEVDGNGEKLLTIHLYPLQSKGVVYDFVKIDFTNNDDGEVVQLPCIVKSIKKVNRKRRKRGNKQ